MEIKILPEVYFDTKGKLNIYVTGLLAASELQAEKVGDKDLLVYINGCIYNFRLIPVKKRKNIKNAFLNKDIDINLEIVKSVTINYNSTDNDIELFKNVCRLVGKIVSIDGNIINICAIMKPSRKEEESCFHIIYTCAIDRLNEIPKFLNRCCRYL